MSLERIRVTVERIGKDRVWAYRKPENGWTILQVLLASGQRCTAKGVIRFEPKHGDLLELEGEWKESRHPGSLGKQEFDFRAAQLHVPTDSRALLHYAATITKGLGPVKESEIWETWGEDWQGADITAMHGISEATAWNWQETMRVLKEHADQTQAIALLLGKGATLNMATSAWTKWGPETTSLVTKDCYALADLPHYGFGDVDGNIRTAFGIEDADPRRVQAAILYVMGKLGDQGDTVADLADVADKVGEMIPGAKGAFDACVKALVDAGKVVVLDGVRLALARDYEAEAMVWERFKVA